EELRRLASNLAILDEAKNGLPEYLMESRLEHDEEYAELTKRVSQLQMALDFEMSSSHNPDSDPNVAEYKQKLIEADELLNARRSKLIAALREEMTAKRN